MLEPSQQRAICARKGSDYLKAAPRQGHLVSLLIIVLFLSELRPPWGLLESQGAQQLKPSGNHRLLQMKVPIFRPTCRKFFGKVCAVCPWQASVMAMLKRDGYTKKSRSLCNKSGI